MRHEPVTREAAIRCKQHLSKTYAVKGQYLVLLVNTTRENCSVKPVESALDTVSVQEDNPGEVPGYSES